MLYKKDVQEPSNYRPNSRLNTITKNFTQILYKISKNYVEFPCLLTEFRSGFRSGRSCLDYYFIGNPLAQILRSGTNEEVYVLFIDFVKAFPFVCHELL